ncbi:MAG: homoserine dehydrogenase, partial [Caulobacteraceae bacterium]|nr:homoserine dehydrogenase [Caulobacter sp.]
MSSPLRVGVAGLGTVGAAVLGLLARRESGLTARNGRPIVVAGVSARDRAKSRGIDLAGLAWHDDPVALARSPDIDCLVELIGGEGGTALEATRAALAAGKHVVTANKAMLARHGLELAAAAEGRGVALKLEAAVAGGIPIVKTLREG